MAEEIFERTRREKLGDLYSGEGKNHVETEIVLPDYKEEAHRIFRVDVRPRIHQKNVYVQGKQLVCEIDGVSGIHILYQSERQGESGVPASFSSQENFSFGVKIPLGEEIQDVDQIGITTFPTVENLSFRLLGPRKLSVRFDVKTDLSMKFNEEYSFYSPDLCEDVHTKTKELFSCKMKASHSEELNFSETIALPTSYLSIGDLCEMNAVLYADHGKTEDGKVHFRGNCEITAAYLSQGEESFISFSQPVEWEQLLMIPEAEEGDFCRIFLTPQFLKATTDINENGENKNIFFEVGYTAQVQIFSNERASAVVDAFSSRRELTAKKAELPLDHVLKMCDFSAAQKEKLPFAEEGMLRAEGIRSSVEFRDSYLEDGKIKVDGRLSLRFLGIFSDGAMRHFEETYDFKCFLVAEDPSLLPENENCRIELCGGVKGVDLVPEEGGIGIRFELYGTLSVFCRRIETVVSEMECGDWYPQKERGILFCYPDSGETLWEFCKAHKTSPKKLCEENAIEGELLPPVVKIIL